MCDDKECGGGCKQGCGPMFETETETACTCRPDDPCYFHGEHGTVSTTAPDLFPVGGATDLRFSSGDDGVAKFKDPARVCELAGLPAPTIPPKQVWSYDLYGTVALTGHEDLDRFLAECFDTMRSKGTDYREGQPESDLLHNFRTVGEDIGIPQEKVWLVYASKHWKAIKSFVKSGGQSESEPIEGRIKDLIVYLLLFLRMSQEMKGATYAAVPEGMARVSIGERGPIGEIAIDCKRATELAGLSKQPPRPELRNQEFGPPRPTFDPFYDRSASPPPEASSPTTDPDAARVAQAVRESEEESVTDIKNRLSADLLGDCPF